ncbi:MAG: response regulator transcription factor [Acidobacteria bacterium]|nr:response regulator transcription factor [Acidobacteriota bacterium]
MEPKGPTLRLLIVDDEPLARRRIASLVRDDHDVEIVGSAASGEEALRIVPRQNIDLIFLDVQMTKMDGFEFLRALNQDPAPAVIFVTAYDEHAIKAFDAQALDYLLKPFDEDRFRKALLRAKKQIEKRRTPKALHRVALKLADRWLFVKADEIDWIEAEGKYARLHIGGSSYLRRESLQQLESQLDPNLFVRIHRSTMVNVDRIKEVRAMFHGDYEAVLRDGTRLTVSRRYRSKLQAVVGSF